MDVDQLLQTCVDSVHTCDQCVHTYECMYVCKMCMKLYSCVTYICTVVRTYVCACVHM